MKKTISKGQRVAWSFKNLKMFRSNSIFVKNFIIIAFLELLVISILTNLYTYKMEKSMLDEIRENNRSELKRSADILDSVVEQMYNFAYYTSIQNDTKMVFMYVDINNASNNVESLRERIDAYIMTFEYVDSVYVYVEKSGYIVSQEGKKSLTSMTDNNWMSAYETVEYENYLMVARCSEGNYPFLLTMIHPVYNAQHKKQGAIIINLDIEKLNDAIGRRYSDRQRFYMTDTGGNLHYSNVVKAIKYEELIPKSLRTVWRENTDDTEYFEIREEDGENVIISAQMTGDGKNVYWLYTPMNFYNERISLTKKYIRQNTIWSIVFGILVSCVLAIQSYRPVQQIMRTVEKEETEIRDEFIKGENQKNEVQYISDMILSAKRKNVKLQLEADEWMERLGHAQLQALQGQINPHFLYNTLDTINWMVMEKIGESNAVSKAIYSLAQLLRISMKRSSYLVPLQEELEHAKLYMELLHIRYPDKLTVEWNIEPVCYEVNVIRLCLQPILENAVSHGLRTRRYKGNIAVKGDVVSDTLVLRIEDDGIGMTLEECLEMNQVLNAEYQIVDNHVGIKNVNQRMKILFGENYGIQMRPREEGGLVVVLCFPK